MINDAIDRYGNTWIISVKETKKKIMFTAIDDYGVMFHFIRYNSGNQYYWTDENYVKVKRMRVRDVFPKWRYW